MERINSETLRMTEGEAEGIWEHRATDAIDFTLDQADDFAEVIFYSQGAVWALHGNAKGLFGSNPRAVRVRATEWVSK